MLGYLVRRLAIFVPGLFAVSLLTFAMVRTAGGDPAAFQLGVHASPESLSRLRREMGLLDPWPVQYGRWFLGAVHGDLGRSYLSGTSVTRELLLRFPATIELAACAMFLAVPLGLMIGSVSALWARTFVDNAGTLAGLLGVAIPTFWLGILLIIVFAVWLGWLPVAGSVDVHLGIRPVTGFSLIDGWLGGGSIGCIDAVRHLILPALTLGGWPMAIVARHMRFNLLEVLHQDYMRTARAKGLTLLKRVWRHALPNALIPVVTVVALETGYLLGGAVITERIFTWPGIGNLTIGAISARDYMLVQGAVLFFAAIFAILNVVAELLYTVLDPRIRY